MHLLALVGPVLVWFGFSGCEMVQGREGFFKASEHKRLTSKAASPSLDATIHLVAKRLILSAPQAQSQRHLDRLSPSLADSPGNCWTRTESDLRNCVLGLDPACVSSAPWSSWSWVGSDLVSDPEKEEGPLIAPLQRHPLLGPSIHVHCSSARRTTRGSKLSRFFLFILSCNPCRQLELRVS